MSAERQRQEQAKAAALAKRRKGKPIADIDAAVLALGVLSAKLGADPDKVLTTLIQANSRDDAALGDKWLQMERTEALARLREKS